ncbi:hypothetical protein [Halomonas organivorans]|uniref:Uncharacterized protein n=2 Tax=Halomonas TaxID=2745 RepID=A0A7W5BX33_9GAMM|nr:hypothetical protein [Halomonas organivorans]MBB3140772.1 hypothetical protein [Halomonas organivorans]
MAELQAQGERLRGLRDRLADRGVPARILDMPAVGLNHLDARLARWGLA